MTVYEPTLKPNTQNLVFIFENVNLQYIYIYLNKYNVVYR